MKRPLVYASIPFALGLILALAFLWLLGVGLPTARAAGPWYVSTTGADDNDCLSWAAACRNIQTAIISATAGDTIYLAAGTYTENLSVDKSLTFAGADAASTIVDGSGTGHVFNITSGDVSFSDLTIQNGYADYGGGGIYTAGALTLTNVNVLSNTATQNGGGVYATRGIDTPLLVVTLVGGRFENNYSRSGGGLNTAQKLIMTGTQFINNTALWGGGGVYAANSAILEGGRFENNQTPSGGGAGLNVGQLLTLTGTQFISNTASSYGGGMYAHNTAVLSGGRFENNHCVDDGSVGGGLYAIRNLILTGTQFIGNVAVADGGGVYAAGYFSETSRLVNTLFARNSAGRFGEAIYLFLSSGAGGSAVILHTTIASPTVGAGQAIYMGRGAVRITNTIVASYTIGIKRSGGFTLTEDYNLFFNAPLSGTIGSGGHSLTGDPRFVNPVGDDYHLTITSPALNRGVDAGATTDMDDNARPDGCFFDIGADEFMTGLGCNRVYLPHVIRDAQE